MSCEEAPTGSRGVQCGYLQSSGAGSRTGRSRDPHLKTPATRLGGEPGQVDAFGTSERRHAVSTSYEDSSYPEDVNEAATWLVGGGILSFMFAPLAIPLILLTAAAVLPLLLLPLAAGVLAAIVAAPVLVIRGLWRRATAWSTAPKGSRLSARNRRPDLGASARP